MSRRHLWSLLVAGTAMLAGCKTPPRDPFERAEQAMQRRELAAALSAYDAVPVVHPRYPEARAAATAVEQSMRHGHELLLEALQLRGQWRDDEALVALARARSVWPAMPGLDSLIAATTQRLHLFARPPGRPATPAEPPVQARPDVVVVEVGSAPTGPVPDPVVTASDEPQSPPPLEPPVAVQAPVVSALSAQAVEPAAPPAVVTPPMAPPVVESAPAAAPSASVPPPVELPAAPLQEPAPSGAVPSVAVLPSPATTRTPHPAEDLVSRALVAIELRLSRQEADLAIGELIELQLCHPEDLRIRLRLAKLLHQRALLRYGGGAIEPAIRDWERVLSLDPHHVDARAFLAVAIGERPRPR
jgi:hypothetical protein